MIKRGLMLLLALSALLPPMRFSSAGAVQQPAAPPILRLLRSDASGVLLELETPGYLLTPQGSYQQLTLPGASLTTEPGQPQLPLVGALIGVPPDAQLDLQVVSSSAVPLPGHFRLSPTPQPAAASAELQPAALSAPADQMLAASAAPYPAAAARLADVAWLREQRVARIELLPFQYRPASGALLWHQRLLVEVRFQHQASRPLALPPASLDSPLEPALRGALLNYDSARAWRTHLSSEQAPPGAGLQRANTDSAAHTPRYKIVVDSDGLYRLSGAELQAAGMNLASVDPRTLRLSSRGQDVAIAVTGEADRRFDLDDSIVFYGQKFRGSLMEEKYTAENVYWLSEGGSPGRRMGRRDGAPLAGLPSPSSYISSVRAEESLVWRTTHFADGNYTTAQESWFWQQITVSKPQVVSRTYTIAIDELATEPFSATVRGSLVATSFSSGSPDHHTRFLINDATLLEDSYWDGRSRHTFAASVPESALREGQNTITLGAYSDTTVSTDELYVDWFEIAYARRFQAQDDALAFQAPQPGSWRYQVSGLSGSMVQVFDISTPLLPRQILSPSVSAETDGYRASFEVSHTAGARYLVVGPAGMRSPRRVTRYVPPDLTSRTNGADYILITHSSFYTAVQQLASHRAAQGLRVKVIDIEDLYNQFNAGIYNPQAVKQFLRFTFANWQAPAPSYVLLVGDGHWNFKNYNPGRYSSNTPITMPPNLVWVDPWQGEVDSANQLVTIVGDDLLPDLHVGRLPVNSVAEINAIIAKTIAYEQAAREEWQSRLLFVADNSGATDAIPFPESAERLIAQHVPEHMNIDRIYLDSVCGPPASPPGPCPPATALLSRTLNQTGTLILTYLGHASVDWWAHERLLTTALVPSLANGARLPIVLSLNCLDGYWSFPTRSSLIETLLRAENRGAVATFSPTGLGVATGHDILGAGFYDALFKHGAYQLGPAALAGKLALYTNGSNKNLIDTFTIFGDPALHIQLRSKVYVPFVRSKP